mgnify:CR=1 FL=1
MVIVVLLHGSKMCVIERFLYEFFKERWDEFPRVRNIYLPNYLSNYEIWGERC